MGGLLSRRYTSKGILRLVPRRVATFVGALFPFLSSVFAHRHRTLRSNRGKNSNASRLLGQGFYFLRCCFHGIREIEKSLSRATGNSMFVANDP